MAWISRSKGRREVTISPRCQTLRAIRAKRLAGCLHRHRSARQTEASDRVLVMMKESTRTVRADHQPTAGEVPGKLVRQKQSSGRIEQREHPFPMHDLFGRGHIERFQLAWRRSRRDMPATLTVPDGVKARSRRLRRWPSRMNVARSEVANHPRQAFLNRRAGIVPARTIARRLMKLAAVGFPTASSFFESQTTERPERIASAPTRHSSVNGTE